MEKFNDYVLMLNLPCPFTETELKRQYKYNLLKYHPDKNRDNEEAATEKTKDINAAYTYLQTFVECNDDSYECRSTNDVPCQEENYAETLGSEYWNIWNDFLYNYLETHWKKEGHSEGVDLRQHQEKIFTICSKFIQSISLDCDNIASKCKEVLGKLDKKATKTMIDLIFSYSSLAKFPLNTASEVKESLRTVAEDVHNIVVISPSINDLFDDNVYVYEKNNEKYFVPLWHHEVVYNIPSDDKENNELVVKCSPELPEHITIDDDNNIHIDVSWKASALLSSETDSIIYTVANKTLSIPLQNIVLKKEQKVTLKKCGISKIDTNDIYNNSCKCDIVFHVSLS
jgi:hypothetical protein